jgi:hypothetical protein
MHFPTREDIITSMKKMMSTGSIRSLIKGSNTWKKRVRKEEQPEMAISACLD